MGNVVPYQSSFPPTYTFSSTFYDAIYGKFDDTKKYAETALGSTEEYLKDLKDTLNELSVPHFNTTAVTIPSPPSINFYRPPISDLDLTPQWPEDEEITRPNFDTVPPISDVTIPQFSVPDPEWHPIVKPIPNYPDPLGVAPRYEGESPPPAPTIVLPAPPTFDEISIPVFAGAPIPEFEGTLPSDILYTPQGMSWQESPYNSEVWDNLLPSVLDGLQNGGTGLDPAVEEQLWDRAQTRQAREEDKLLRKVRDVYGAKGYSAPPGALAAAEMEVFTENAVNNTTLNTEIAIKQAEMAKQHQQFITEKGIQLEQILRGFHDSQSARMLDATKAIAASGIEVFNAVVSRYNASLEAYKTHAAVYAERVKAALTKVEVFKAEVEGAKVSAQVQETLASIYNKQIEAIRTTVQMYGEQVSAFEAANKVELQRLEGFRLETQAYIAQIEAEQARFQVYGIEADVEKAKAGVYESQVKAYLGKIEAIKAQIQSEAVAADAVIRSNQAQIELYRADLAAYEVDVNAEAKRIDAVVRAYEGNVSAYNAETTAMNGKYQAVNGLAQARIEEARLKVDVNLEELKAKTQAYISINDTKVKGMEGLANIGSQLTSAAWNAVNTSMTMGSTLSRGSSTSRSWGYSLGEDHNYNISQNQST